MAAVELGGTTSSWVFDPDRSSIGSGGAGGAVSGHITPHGSAGGDGGGLLRFVEDGIPGSAFRLRLTRSGGAG